MLFFQHTNTIQKYDKISIISILFYQVSTNNYVFMVKSRIVIPCPYHLYCNRRDRKEFTFPVQGKDSGSGRKITSAKTTRITEDY